MSRHGPGPLSLWAVGAALVLAGAAATLVVMALDPRDPEPAAPAVAAARSPAGPEAGSTPPGPEAAPAASRDAGAPAAADLPVAPSDGSVVEGALAPGRTLVGSLSEHGVGGSVAHEIATAMSPVFNFRYARPGDAYRLVRDAEGRVLRFDYRRSPLEAYVLWRENGGLHAERLAPERVRRRARLAGVVTASLYDAIEALGGEVELANDFAEIFAWDLDFSRAVQRGDEFAILYERVHVRDDRTGELRYVHPGRILAARYSNAAADYTAVYHETEPGSGGYYRPDGASVERQFLRAPLNYRRISSRYSLSRFHPILKVRRPHKGIDYAADVGTAVWSVADGTVVFRGWSGGYGRMVRVRHTNGYESQYAHLSRYASGLRVGDRVAQKQVLGFVGSSGLSTGPHLDFRLKRYGRFINPESLRMPAGDPIPAEAMPGFRRAREELLAALEPAPPTVATSEAL